MINNFMHQIFAANPYLSRLYPVFHYTFVIGIIILQIFLAKKKTSGTHITNNHILLFCD